MEIRLVRWVIAGLISSVFVLVLSGCIGGEGVWRESPVRDFPYEVEVSLSIGDTRQKVRSFLGKPFVDARSHGVEVYRKAGRDIDYMWMYVPIPIPVPGDKAVVFVLVVYDEDDVVKVIEPRIWIDDQQHYRGVYFARPHWKLSAGGFMFTESYMSEPRTLWGPSIPLKYLAELNPVGDRCGLALVNGMCAMGQVFLDNHEFIDLSPADVDCQGTFNGTFIREDISTGKHHLRVKQQHNEFEAEFECESGENVYAELEATSIPHWWYGTRLEGAILINKSPYKNLIKMVNFYPLLWHRGEWYDPNALDGSGKY